MIVPLRIDFGELGDLNIRYTTDINYTDEDIESLYRKDDVVGLAHLPVSVIVEWDFLDEQRKPMPVTPETVSSLGADVIVMIVDAILRDHKKYRKRQRRK